MKKLCVEICEKKSLEQELAEAYAAIRHLSNACDLSKKSKAIHGLAAWRALTVNARVIQKARKAADGEEG